MLRSKYFFYSLFFYIISAFGVSLSIKAAIGVSAFNAMNLALSSITSLKVGTITFIMNVCFLTGHMIMTRFKKPKGYLMKFISVLLLGSVINFILYNVLVDWQLTSYVQRLIIILIGNTIGGIAVAFIVYFDVIAFPMESLCVDIQHRTNIPFAYLRYGVDVISLAVSIIISLSLSLPFFAREGTIISMIIFTTTLNKTRSYLLARKGVKLEVQP